MAQSTLFGVCLLGALFALGSCVSSVLEAEHFAQDFDSNRTIPRSNAGNLAAVHLYRGETLDFKFCLRVDDEFLVQNVNFSNDGTPDLYILTLDGEPVGNFSSFNNSNYGLNWNDVMGSDVVGGAMTVLSGEHTLSVNIEEDEDEFGAELDSVILTFISEENYDISCDFGETTTDFTTTEETTTECEGEDC